MERFCRIKSPPWGCISQQTINCSASSNGKSIGRRAGSQAGIMGCALLNGRLRRIEEHVTVGSLNISFFSRFLYRLAFRDHKNWVN